MSTKRKQNTLPFVIIFAVILLLMSIPKLSKEKISGLTIAIISPLWETVTAIPLYFTSSNTDNPDVESPSPSTEAWQRLEIENRNLKNEINKLHELFEHELYIISQMTSSPYSELSELNEHATAHQNELRRLLKIQMDAIPARVIFRSNSTWSSSLWLNVGSANNEEYKNTVIAKNSPVVVGKSIIGVIDYVGTHQSRVRLITDSGLTPSVRASRGESQNRLLREHLNSLAGSLSTRNELFSNAAEKTQFIQMLNQLKKQISCNEETWLLAKGELQGRSYPLWRSPGQHLKGIGFNYDYPDAEGPARDLRSGQPLNAPESIKSMPIIQEGDLLVTTGLDGVFPAGLLVAEVSKIHLLREGDYFYELEAKPTAGNFDDLATVFVLPPVGFSTSDQPPIIGR
ncbi:MAG: rod shape-determining protein MreC [Chlamydiota bacterium]|nr:rod shape-determining protein MreC [Chlamydiota bacterium]